MPAHSEFTTVANLFIRLALAVMCFQPLAWAQHNQGAENAAATLSGRQSGSSSGAFVGGVRGLTSARAKGPHVTVTLRLPEVFLEKSEIAIEFELEPDWHIYWINPGDSGEEPRFKFAKAENLEIGPALFPTPTRIPAGPLTNFGFSKAKAPVAIRFPVHVASLAESGGTDAGNGTDVLGRGSVVVELSYLVCKEECIPAKAVLAASAPIRKTDAVGKSKLEYESQLYPPDEGPGSRASPIESKWRRVSEPGANSFSYALKVSNAKSVEFFPLTQPGSIGAPVFLASDGGQVLPEGSAIATGDELVVGLDPAQTANSNFDGEILGLVVDKASRAAQWTRFSKADVSQGMSVYLLALAFLGGLLLNLMPCVFPVVSLKIMSFMNESRGDSNQIKVHASLYALGVLVSLWILVAVLLALRAAGTSVGWGFQLQSPTFLFLLYAVFIFLGFNLLGLFEINYSGPRFLQNVLSIRGKAGSFFTGLLTTIVATPCSAPFMGVAIGAALSAGSWQAFMVFTSLGLGLSLPYIVLGFSPGLVTKMPRPGVWMERMKQGLAFPLFLTAVWLLWVLSQSTESAALILILAWTVGAGFFSWALHFQMRRTTWISLFGLLLASALALSTLGSPETVDLKNATSGSSTAVSRWQPYSEGAIKAARATGQGVFVDFTASWCVTCQVNKRLVLDTHRGNEIFNATNVIRLRADWTKRDQEISDALARLGRNSVPVYAYYPPGETSEVKLLPEILTFEILETALRPAK